MILLLYEALRDLLSEWTSLNTWFINVIFLLSFYVSFVLLYCYYYSVMYVTVMPVGAYMALAFVFGFLIN